MQLQQLSETLLQISVAKTISQEASREVLALYRAVLSSEVCKQLGIHDVVPTFTALGFHIDVTSPLFDAPTMLLDRLKTLPLHAHFDAVRHTIPVQYDGEDIAQVAQATQLAIDEVIAHHTKSTYTVAMQGFKAYFPYLLGLNPQLYLPRRATVRKRIKKGAVAIGGMQAGIYTQDSPGGWHILGYTDFENFSAIQAGDEIVFKEVRC